MRNNIFFSVVLFCVARLMTGCMAWDYELEKEDLSVTGPGLFIVNEGSFQYGNATLSFYDPQSRTVENEIFFRANGMKLGDVAQSMTLYGDRGWIVVNNSHVVFSIDTDNFVERGRIENLTSPRYIHFVNDSKAYITQLWDNRIFIVDPQRYEVTGYIEVPDMSPETGSTEQMVQIGRYVYCNCWSYQSAVIKIDTTTDEIVGRVSVGVQPESMAVDCNQKLWVLTDGGYEGSPFGYESPLLVRIDPTTLAIEKRFRFGLGATPYELHVSGDGRKLYWISDDVWEMDVTASRLPSQPLIESRGTKYYGLTVDPQRGDIYVGDAIDYQQPGIVYRYSSSGELIDQFYAGVTPGAYCWKP